MWLFFCKKRKKMFAMQGIAASHKGPAQFIFISRLKLKKRKTESGTAIIIVENK